MHSFLPFTLFLAVLYACPCIHAARIPFTVHVNNRPPSHLHRRAPLPVSNTGNAQYIGNMTLGGTPVRVLLDTGSSDLWVSFPGSIPSTNDVGKSVTLAYAVGKAVGNVRTTTAELGGYTVNDQAFLLVTDTSTFSTDIHAQGYDGLFGLGPNSGSVIRKKLSGSTGDSMLTRIFQQNKTSPNYITVLLDRKGDPSQNYTGQMTIAETVPGFSNITSMPKLDVDTVNRILKADQHWQALTDKNVGIIGPDGQPITVKSIVPGAPDGQYVAVFDSGFTFSQVPRDVSDAIYGRVQGAVYDTKDEIWTVPCGQLLNISFNFGGVNYPIHPLDTVDDNFNRLDANGNKVCIGAFQPITSAFSLLGHYDMIMGMSFMRNAYTLFDFGNWISDKSEDTGHPYIQLAAMTNVATAHNDFVKIRMSGNDLTGDPKWALLPQSEMQHSPVSEEEKKKKYQEMVLSRWPYILLGCLIVVLLSVGFCIWRCCCRKKPKKVTTKALFLGEPQSTAYLPLEEQNRQRNSFAPSAPYPGGMPSPSHYPPPPQYTADYPSAPQGGHHHA